MHVFLENSAYSYNWRNPFVV